jgi:hypothetical protein
MGTSKKKAPQTNKPTKTPALLPLSLTKLISFLKKMGALIYKQENTVKF